jgi:WD40 repeat protein
MANCASKIKPSS